MSKPFFYRITAADFLAAVVTVPEADRSAWVLSLALDMVSGDSDKAQSDFAKTIIAEAAEFSEKKRSAANKRWSAKGMQTDAVHSTAMPEAVTVTEVKPIVRKKKVANEKFGLFWDAFADKRSREQALKSWIKINPDEELADKIIRGAELYAKHRVNILAKNGTPKMAQGWLTDKRWEDEDIQINADLSPQQRQFEKLGYHA